MNRTVVLVGLGALSLSMIAGAACVGGQTVAETVLAADSGSADTSTGATDSSSSKDVVTAVDSAVPFTVSKLAGLVLWLDAAKGVTQVSNAVSAWADQSGNNNNAAQSHAAPSFVGSSINGLPAIHVEGGSGLVIADSATLKWGTGDFYIAIVMKHTTLGPDAGASATYGMLFSKQDVPYPYRGEGVFVNMPSLPCCSTITTSLGIQTTFGAPGYVLLTTATGLNDGVARQYSFTHTDTSLIARVNGALSGTADAPDGGAADGSTNVNLDNTAPLSIGANTGGTQAMVGDISEIIAVKGSISAGDIANVESYFKTKYAL